uniref:Uncharacterized protein n=1 Tax=viral metagenome TaxID=1070528 RepID=A0A6M3LF85_9ZZZZ
MIECPKCGYKFYINEFCGNECIECPNKIFDKVIFELKRKHIFIKGNGYEICKNA